MALALARPVPLGCAHPRVSSVITGASRPDQVVENMKALEIVPKLTSDVMARIESVFGAEANVS